MKLKDALENPEKKPVIINDCVDLIDAEVKDKKGLGGMAIKAGYKAVKGVKPGFVRNVVTDLLPEFADSLSPLELEAKEAGVPVGSYLVSKKSEAANAMLSVTDKKASGSTNGVVKSAYNKLRPTAEKHVEAAMPRLGALIDKHTSF